MLVAPPARVRLDATDIDALLESLDEEIDETGNPVGETSGQFERAALFDERSVDTEDSVIIDPGSYGTANDRLKTDREVARAETEPF